jgi:hypothetical protein
MYKVSLQESSMFWEVTALVILSKTVYIFMCPIRTIPRYWYALNFQKGIVPRKLYQLCHLNNKYRY